MYRRKEDQSESPFKHLFNRLEKAHKEYGDDQMFTPLDVLAMLHLAMPKGLGWDVAYALSIKTGSTRQEAELSLEKLSQLTMKLGPSTDRPTISDYECTDPSSNLIELDF